ncbi:MAG: hypothetical protein SFZ23_13495 [Planctomycetota bacterium]|nr:hypothetical protein [Planctomycetota bacterium]
MVHGLMGASNSGHDVGRRPATAIRSKTAKARSTLSLVAALGVVAGGLIGCGPSKKKYDINVTMDPSMRDTRTQTYPNIDVELVGVPEADLEQFRAQSPAGWFGSQLRADRRDRTHAMLFTNDSLTPAGVKKTDEIWKKWADARSVFIFSNNPGTFTPGNDLRRRELPLAGDRWAGTEINLLIKPSGLELVTPMLPEKD